MPKVKTEIIDPDHDPRFDEDGKPVKPVGPLRTEKREKYCQERVAGYSKPEAYQRAGYNAPDKTQASKSAYNLEKKPDVQARIFELKMGSKAFMDDAAMARSDPIITQKYINTQMKLLLVMAKNDGNLKVAKDMITMMGETIGMFQKDTKDDGSLPAPQLPAPNQGATINIEELNQVFEGDPRGDGTSVAEAVPVDAEYTEVTEEP